MKTLLFLRHGKSDWDAPFDRDHDRPLAKRGRKDAKRMGKFLTAIDLVPDSIICSTALRARRTMERANKAGDWEAPVRLTETLYHAYPDDLLREIRAEPDTTRTLMLVGHEPTWSETVSQFIDGGDIRYPTAALARVDMDIVSWREAAFGVGELIMMMPPKMLP